MGKRKKSGRAPPGPKKREALSTTFQCLFCNHENSVLVKIFKKEAYGTLDCRICGQHYETSINYLSAPVDVYSDWIDACEAVAGETSGEKVTSTELSAERRKLAPAKAKQPVARTNEADNDDDLDGFIENDEEEDDEQRYTLEED